MFYTFFLIWKINSRIATEDRQSCQQVDIFSLSGINSSMTVIHNPRQVVKPSIRKEVIIARLLQDLAVPGRSESSKSAAQET